MAVLAPVLVCLAIVAVAQNTCDSDAYCANPSENSEHQGAGICVGLHDCNCGSGMVHEWPDAEGSCSPGWCFPSNDLTCNTANLPSFTSMSTFFSAVGGEGNRWTTDVSLASTGSKLQVAITGPAVKDRHNFDLSFGFVSRNADYRTCVGFDYSSQLGGEEAGACWHKNAQEKEVQLQFTISLFGNTLSDEQIAQLVDDITNTLSLNDALSVIFTQSGSNDVVDSSSARSSLRIDGEVPTQYVTIVGPSGSITALYESEAQIAALIQQFFPGEEDEVVTQFAEGPSDCITGCADLADECTRVSCDIPTGVCIDTPTNAPGCLPEESSSSSGGSTCSCSRIEPGTPMSRLDCRSMKTGEAGERYCCRGNCGYP